MNSKIKKTSKSKILYIFIVVIICVFAFLDSQFSFLPFAGRAYIFIRSGLPLILFLITFLYNNVKLFFVYFNKFMAYLKNDEVSVTCTLKFQVAADDEILNTNNNNLVSFLEEDSKISEIRNTGSSFSFKSRKNARKSDYFISYDKNDNDTHLVRVKFDSSPTYRNSTKEFETFYSVMKEYIDYFSKPANFKPQYSNEIYMDKYNPFYAFYLKNIGCPEDTKFLLTYKIDDVQVKIEKNKMILISTSEESIKQISEDFIPFSSVG